MNNILFSILDPRIIRMGNIKTLSMKIRVVREEDVKI